MRAVPVGVFIAVVVAIAGYAASPWLLAWAVPKYLESLGVDASSFEFSRPGASQLRIDRAVLRLGVIELTADSVEITYDWRALRHGRVREVTVAAFEVAIGASDDPTVIEIPALWSLIPADRVVVSAFSVENAVPQASVAGKFDFDAAQAHAVFGVESELLPVPLDGRLDLEPQGGLKVSLTQRGSDVQALSVKGIPDGAGALDVDGTLDITGQTFALIADLAGVDGARGHVRGSLEGRVPWPVGDTSSLDQVALTAQLSVATTDALPLLEGDAVSGTFSLAIESGHMQVEAPTLTIAARSLTWAGVNYVIEESARFALEVKAAMPLLPNESLTGVTASIVADVALSLASDDPAAYANTTSFTAHVNVDATADRARVAIDEGAEFEVSTPTVRDVTVEVRSPLAFDYTVTTGALEAKDVALTVRTPELELLDQRIALRSARLDVATLSWVANRLQASATAQTRASAKAVPVSLVLDLNTAELTGSFEVAVASNVTKPMLKAELSGWRSSYDLDRGALNAQFRGTFAMPTTGVEVQGSGRIALADAVMHYDDTIIAGLTFDLPVTLAAAGVSAGPAVVTAQQIDPGVPVTDIRLTVDVRPERIVVADVGAELLGGRVSIDAIDFDVASVATSFGVQLSEIQLKHVLALEGEDIVGDGVLDGTLPIQVESEGLTVTGGRIAARPPGGRLSYRGSMGAAAAPGLDLAIQALRNFQYESLNADVDYALDGQLTLAVKLRGRSPDVEKGRPIHFNLNVSENIPALLETLRASESVTERVQQRFSR